METKHTPGPWNFHGSTLVQDKGNRLNLGTFHEAPGLGNAAAANAQLIATAPDLLLHLQRLVRAIDRAPANFADGLADEARSVIARATGNQ